MLLEEFELGSGSVGYEPDSELADERIFLLVKRGRRTLMMTPGLALEAG